MPIDDILLEAEDKMQKTEHVVQNEFAGVRTGKASPGLVENIIVDVYGSQMRIRELAGITTPEARMLMVQPWDAGSIQPIEKAIQKSNLGLNPAVQGKFIRIVLPDLSQERREEFVKAGKAEQLRFRKPTPEDTYLKGAAFGTMDMSERLQLLDQEGMAKAILYPTIGLFRWKLVSF